MWSGTLRNFVLFSIIIVARLSKLIKCEPVTSLKGYCPQIPKPEDDENLRPRELNLCNIKNCKLGFSIQFLRNG